MKMFIKLVIILLVVFLVATLPSNSFSESTRQDSKIKFKYLIFKNTLNEKPSIQYSRRTLNVFLEEKAFSEQSIKELYLLLSNRFPEPQWLEAWVYTNLNQVETPEEADSPKSSTTKDNPDHNRSHWAWIYRNKDNVFFRYNPNPPNRDVKTIVITGKDPYSVNR